MWVPTGFDSFLLFVFVCFEFLRRILRVVVSCLLAWQALIVKKNYCLFCFFKREFWEWWSLACLLKRHWSTDWLWLLLSCGHGLPSNQTRVTSQPIQPLPSHKGPSPRMPEKLSGDWGGSHLDCPKTLPSKCVAVAILTFLIYSTSSLCSAPSNRKTTFHAVAPFPSYHLSSKYPGGTKFLPA